MVKLENCICFTAASVETARKAFAGRFWRCGWPAPMVFQSNCKSTKETRKPYPMPMLQVFLVKESFRMVFRFIPSRKKLCPGNSSKAIEALLHEPARTRDNSLGKVAV